MKNLDQLISHTVLATDQNHQFFITTQGIPDGIVAMDLWSAENNQITHILTKWVFVFSAIHAQDIAELWLEEKIDNEELINGGYHRKDVRRTTPKAMNLGTLPFPTQLSSEVDVRYFDWSVIEKIT